LYDFFALVQGFRGRNCHRGGCFLVVTHKFGSKRVNEREKKGHFIKPFIREKLSAELENKC
jgi:hypothetical protein